MTTDGETHVMPKRFSFNTRAASGAPLWKRRKGRCPTCNRILTPLVRETPHHAWRPAPAAKMILRGRYVSFDRCEGGDCTKPLRTKRADRELIGDIADAPPLLHPTAIPAAGLGSHGFPGVAIFRTDGIGLFLRSLAEHRAGPCRTVLDLSPDERTAIEALYRAPLVPKHGPVAPSRCIWAQRKHRCLAARAPGRFYCSDHGPDHDDEGSDTHWQ